MIIKDITTGALNDIERATALARSMVTKYGMSDILGPIQFGNDSDEVFIGREMGHSRNYGEDVAATIDKEVKRIIDTAYEEAIRLIKENIDVLHATAKILVEKEKITGDEFRQLFKEAKEAKEARLNVVENEEKEKVNIFDDTTEENNDLNTDDKKEGEF